MATVKIDQGAMRALARSPEIRAAVLAKAEQGKGIAEGLAQEFRRTGEYAGSFNVRSEVVDMRIGPRVAGILENTSDHAYAVEWGNAHDNRAHHVLGRTIDALGAG